MGGQGIANAQQQQSGSANSYMELRQLIGWIGFVMPFFVRVVDWIAEQTPARASISAYYYTGMRDVFVSTLVLVGVLLTSYRGVRKSDHWVAIACGVAAIGIALFPMDPTWAPQILERHPKIATEECYVNHGLLCYHFYFVATFFALSFYLVFFRFKANTPKHPALPTRQKERRNEVYKYCGIAMLGAMAWIGYLFLTGDKEPIYWPEAIAVLAFAAAWLVKGQGLLRDP